MFEKVLKIINAGDPVDLSQIPPPPPGYTSNYHLDSITVTCTCTHECNPHTKHTQLFHSLPLAVLCQCLNPEVSLVVPTCVSQQVKKLTPPEQQLPHPGSHSHPSSGSSGPAEVCMLVCLVYMYSRSPKIIHILSSG